MTAAGRTPDWDLVMDEQWPDGTFGGARPRFESPAQTGFVANPDPEAAEHVAALLLALAKPTAANYPADAQ